MRRIINAGFPGSSTGEYVFMLDEIDFENSGEEWPEISPEKTEKKKKEKKQRLSRAELVKIRRERHLHNATLNPNLSYVVEISHSLCKKFIEKRKRTNAEGKNFCLICRAVLSKTMSVREHIRGKKHLKARTKHGCEKIWAINNKQYYCDCCDRRSRSFINLFHHLTSEGHAETIKALKNDKTSENLGENKDENFPEVDGTARENGDAESPFCEESTPSWDGRDAAIKSCIFVVKRNAKKSFCQICEEGQLTIATRNITEHINSELHSSALMKFGCDNILFNENDRYECTCCHLEFENVDGVHLHVKDKKHLISMLSSIKKKRDNATIIFNKIIDDDCKSENSQNLSSNSEDVKEENLHQPQFNSIITSMANQTSRLLKQVNSKERAKIMNDLRFNESLRKKNFFARCARLFDCSFCNYTTDDPVKLHTHMTRHLCEELFPASNSNEIQILTVNGNMTESDQSTLEKDSKLQPREEGSEESIKVENSSIDGSWVILPPEENDDSHQSMDSEEEDMDVLPLEDDSNIDDKSEASEAGNPKISIIDQLPKYKNKILNKSKMKNIARALNFEDDWIYDLTEGQARIKRGLKFCFAMDESKIYCLVCRETIVNTSEKCFDHLMSGAHKYFFDLLMLDNALFAAFPDEFSDFRLVQQYMQESSEDSVECFVCVEKISSDDASLAEHISNENHKQKRQDMRLNAMKNYEDMKIRLNCDWYSIEKYSCLQCNRTYNSEVHFVKHLKLAHAYTNNRKIYEDGKKMIIDFCPFCTTLWYGDQLASIRHSQNANHWWLARDGYFVLYEIPPIAKNLLARSEQWVNDRIDYLDGVSILETMKNDTIIRDIENIARMKFPRAKAYAFGSRVSGLGNEDSDIDIYIDCRNRNDGSALSEDQVLYFMTGIHESICKQSRYWSVEEFITDCRSPIIKTIHRETGIACDISVINELSVENTKLIRTYIEAFPPCRKLILILKQWISACNLKGPGLMTSYSICWFVIFYLQRESILPSVAALITMKNKSKRVAGWETGVTHDFSYWQPRGNWEFTELLKGFFKFYANFDFRFEIACPLIGESIKKIEFVDTSNLPPEMEPYVSYMKKSNSEPFRIDSVMCIQDPFDLQHNLTKAVKKSCLNRFRKFCSRSLEVMSL